MEDYHNNKNIRRASEGHAGGGRETIIQFVVALYYGRSFSYVIVESGSLLKRGIQ